MPSTDIFVCKHNASEYVQGRLHVCPSFCVRPRLQLSSTMPKASCMSNASLQLYIICYSQGFVHVPRFARAQGFVHACAFTRSAQLLHRATPFHTSYESMPLLFPAYPIFLISTKPKKSIFARTLPGMTSYTINRYTSTIQ